LIAKSLESSDETFVVKKRAFIKPGFSQRIQQQVADSFNFQLKHLLLLSGEIGTSIIQNTMPKKPELSACLMGLSKTSA